MEVTGDIGDGCITDQWRKLLTGMVERDADKKLVISMLEQIPRCEDFVKKEKERSERKGAVPWGIKPVYVDEEGNRTPHESLSKLISFLGQSDPEMKMSGSICNTEGKKCRATSAVEILQLRGYKVDGNGDPKKAAEGGEKLTIYHPTQEIVATKAHKKG